MELSFPELIDRFGIILQKKQLLKGDVDWEYMHLKDAIAEFIKKQSLSIEDLEYIMIMCLNNAHIWSLESDLKNDNLQNLMLQEVGRRALSIRAHNAIRVDAKNKLARTTKSGFQDIKVDHASDPLGSRGY